MYRVYVDEAGDRGMKPGSSYHFVVSAAIVADPLDGRARIELASTRAAVRRQPGHVLHFRNLSHSQKIKVTQDIGSGCIETITNVIICKRHLAGAASPANMAYITRSDPMYLWALRLLLERVSWWVRDHGGGPAIVTFAHIKNFQTQKLHNYRAALAMSPTTIFWPSFQGHQFRFGGMAAVEMLQVADACASALFDAVEPDAYGNVEDRYLLNLSGKLYRYYTSPLTSYGLKVFPAAHGNPGGSLHHLRLY